MSKYFSLVEKYLTIVVIRIAFVTKNYDKVNSQLEIALTKRPDDFQLLSLAQEIYRETQNWTAFFNIYKRIENIYPHQIQLKRNLGTALLSSFRYKEASQQFEYCLNNWDLDKKYSTAFVNTKARLAICYEYLGMHDMAKSLLLQSDITTSWDLDLIYGRLLQCAVENNEGIQDFLDEQIRTFPKLYALYYWKGLYVHYYLHDPKGALYWYQLALAKTNSFDLRTNFESYFISHVLYAHPIDILMQSFNICVELGETRKAYWLLLWSKLKLFDYGGSIQTASIYIEIRNNYFEKAENSSRALLRKRISPELSTEAWILLALAQLGQGKLDESLHSANQSLLLDSTSDRARKLIGNIQLHKKDWVSALNTYLNLIDMNRFNFKYWENLGFCYANIVDISSAKTSYEHAVLLNPFEANIWVDLAGIYIKLGDNDKALTAYQKGLKYAWLDPKKRQLAVQAIRELERK